jgi:hypothetical protein
MAPSAVSMTVVSSVPFTAGEQAAIASIAMGASARLR